MDGGFEEPVLRFVDGRSERPKAAFSAEGIYRFKLVVNDGLRDSDPDEVTVAATPRDRVSLKTLTLRLAYVTPLVCPVAK